MAEIAADAAPWWEIVQARLRANEIDLIAQVPDQVLAPLVRGLEADPYFEVVRLTREEEGVGILTGGYIGGRRGALLLQSSGLGNSLNALAGLTLAYRVPLLMVVSPRGRLGEFNPSQVPMGQAFPRLLEAMGVQTVELERIGEVAAQVDQAARSCFSAGSPVALVVSTLLSGGKRG